MLLRDEFLSTQNLMNSYKKIPNICGETEPEKLIKVLN